ncbi:MAG: PAS domain S-box protein [Desulfobacteraceae bacterium]|nr:PAS domain S-box protein [Desulfobacteraceae bacterium]
MKKIAKTKNNAYTKNADRALEAFFEISNAVHSTTNLDELYKVIHKALARILNVNNFIISIYNEEKDSISFPYYIDEKDSPPGDLENFSKIRSLTGEIIIGKKPRFFTNQEIIDFAKKKNQQVVGTISKVWIGAPLIVKKKVIGVIAVQSYTSEDDYQISDLDILISASQHIALAIERKEVADALQKQRQVLEKIIESSPVGITLVENRIFKWVNNEIVKVLGYNRKDEFENKSVEILHASKKDYDHVGEMINKDLVSKGKADFEYNLMRKDGSLFPAHVVIARADIKESSITTVVIITDLSARRDIEDAKIQYEKLQGVLEMAGAVCHELNQPLQAILGYAELLVIDRDSDMKVDTERLHKIVHQITRIGKITKKLSSITKYKTVKYVGDVKIVDIWGSDEPL